MKAFSRNGQWLALLDQCVVSGCNFLVLLYLGRKLPASDFGIFSLALMSTLFLANLHRASLTRPLNLLGAAEDEELRLKRLRAVLKAHWLLVPLAAIVLFALSVFFFPGLLMWMSALVYIGLFCLQDSMRRYWYTSGQIGFALRTDGIAYGGQVLILLGAGMQVTLAASDVLLLMALPFGLAFLFDWFSLPRQEGKPLSLFLLAKDHWQLSQWLLLTVLVVWAAGQLYPFLLASLGPVAVATFMASRNLLNVVNLLVQSFDNYLPSRLTALLVDNGPDALRRHLWTTLMQVGSLGLLFLALIWLAADPLLNAVYAGNYNGSGDVLRMLAIGSFCALMGMAVGAYSLAMHDTRAPFLANLGAAAVTATVGLWLVKTHGISGAAMGLALSSATALLLQGGLVWARLEALTRERAVHA